jgi:four helix bundle protein
MALGLRAPHHLKDQLRRAASSIALNLSEGSAKDSRADRRRFYFIALGSVRECEAIIELLRPDSDYLALDADKLARHVYKLCQSLK